MSLIPVHRMSVFHVAGVALLSDSMPWLSADLSSVSALSPRHSIHITISGIVASSFRFLYLHTPSHSFSLLLLSLKSHQSSPEYHMCIVWGPVCIWECVVIVPILLYISIFQIVTKETFALHQEHLVFN